MNNDVQRLLPGPRRWTDGEAGGDQEGAPAGGFDWSRYANTQGGQAHRMSREDFDATFDDEGVGDLFELLFGPRRGHGQGRRTAAIKGEDLDAETALTLAEAYHGSTRLIHLHGKKNERGNLLVKVEIQMPDHLSEQEVELFRKLAALKTPS
jgi:DnaJ-class molecular chaperone